MSKTKPSNPYFTELYNEYYEKVLRICRGYVNGDIEIGKDLTQETFVRVWQNLQGFKGNSQESTWIYRIAINTCLLHNRNSKRTSINQFRFLTDDGRDEELIESRMKKMFASINRLSPQNRSIILLELESLPQKEIAEIMGMSHSAIRVRISRIKQTLSKYVKE